MEVIGAALLSSVIVVVAISAAFEEVYLRPPAHRLMCANLLGYGVKVASWFLAPVVGVRIPVPQPDKLRGLNG